MAETRVICAVILVALLLFVGGFLIGYFTGPSQSDDDKELPRTKETSRFKSHRELYSLLDAENIRKYLRDYTDKPHVAGSKIQLEYGEKIVDEWKSYKMFDKVESFPYNVLLSYLEEGETNVVQVLSDSGDILHEFKGKEKILEPSENNTAVIPPILGYAKPGKANGKLLYVNYGRKEDFEALKNMTGFTNCSGYIAIMRYGKIYRGNKIDLAAECGAEGAILYNDPADSAPQGEKETYPNTWWLPPSGVQRGNLRAVKGDPLTPEVPAMDGIMRADVEDVFMPAISATPLPYGQAKELLKLIKGRPAPKSWIGGFDFTYNVGIGKTGPNVAIQVNAKLQRRNITNIIGTILGEDEPDKWVLLGAHRDAWAFGAVDSSSGTAVIMEIARGLNELMKTGWRPRRTIKLCSWGAEEQGLIGSIEWVEQQSKIVRERAAAYINIDAVVRGNYSLFAKGSPLFKELVFDEAKKVMDPRDESRKNELTLFQRWKKNKKYPKFGSLGSGSDFVPFYQFVGVPSMAFHYAFYNEGVTTYPVYHSIHDTFNWVEKFVDPSFQIHLSVCKLTARLLLRMSDSDLFPIDVTSYSDALITSMDTLRTEVWKNDTISIDHIEEAIKEFNKTAHEFESRKKSTKPTDFSRLRIINNQMMNLEKIFINPYGLPGRPDIRNIVFAPSIVNSYGSSSFPGISDTVSETPVDWWEVKKQINILYKSIKEANEFLKPVWKQK